MALKNSLESLLSETENWLWDGDHKLKFELKIWIKRFLIFELKIQVKRFFDFELRLRLKNFLVQNCTRFIDMQ